jgi:hypothetical protein
MFNLSNVGSILAALLKRGPVFIWIYFQESVLFDILNRTNTHLRLAKTEGGKKYRLSEYEDGVLYVASFTSVVTNTVNIAKDFLGNKFSAAQFIDLGCGKGKALLVYALNFKDAYAYPCIGIDYDIDLCNKAAINLKSVKLSSNLATVICASALDMKQYISSEILIVYTYNSFKGITFHKTLDNLSSYPHILIYVDPYEEAMLSEYGYRILARRKGRYNADTWLVAASSKILEIL